MRAARRIARWLVIKRLCFGTTHVLGNASSSIPGLAYFRVPDSLHLHCLLFLHEPYLLMKMPNYVFWGCTGNVLRQILFHWGNPFPASATKIWIQQMMPKSQRRDQTKSTSIQAKSQSLSVCCCSPTQCSCLCLPVQVLQRYTYLVKTVSDWGQVYLAVYFLALGFCFVRSCHHYQAGDQCLYWVGVRGRHKQNQPSCALKNQARIIYIFHVRKMTWVLAADGRLEHLEGEWRIGRIAPLFLGPLPDNHSTFYSWSQRLPSLLRPSKCYDFLAAIPSLLSEPRMACKGRALLQNGVNSLNCVRLGFKSLEWTSSTLSEVLMARPVHTRISDLNKDTVRNLPLHWK